MNAPWQLGLAAAGPIHPLVHATVALNAAAGLLVVVGLVLIKARREQAHKWVMLSAFAASIAFLVCYLAYHVWPVGAKVTKFPGTGTIRGVYYSILLSHTVLAAAVPVLAIVTIYLGLRDRRRAHRKLAAFTYPIWLYVSITGVVVYWMLYHMRL